MESVQVTTPAYVTQTGQALLVMKVLLLNICGHSCKSRLWDALNYYMQLSVTRHVWMMVSVYHQGYVPVQEAGVASNASKVNLTKRGLAWLPQLIYHEHVFLATCSPGCQHGGTCIAPQQCNCTEQWRGLHCEQGKLLIIIGSPVAQVSNPLYSP